MLRQFVEYSTFNNLPKIIRNDSNLVNELFASFLIDKFKYTLDRTKTDSIMKNILPNWKILSSDIDRYIEVNVAGELKRYYVNDDDTFVDRSTLSLKDGEYFDVRVGGKLQRLYAKSEKDHAFILPEDTRHQVISLLGGDPSRTLSVSANLSSNVEFNYSLSAPRQNFYVLSCILSSVVSTPLDGVLLQNTNARYQLVNTTSEQGLSSLNEYIKYKANHKVFVIHDEDIILDYIEQTSSVFLNQTDVLSDSPKENKSVAILTRQIPWYIIVYPTNRPDFVLLNSKSKITNLEVSGIVSRSLKFKTTNNTKLNKDSGSLFVTREFAGIDSQNVYEEVGNQNIIYKINSNALVYQQGYFDLEGNIVPASQVTRTRKKTAFRVVKEVISELDSNYLLELNGLGKNITELDAFNKLNFLQYNELVGIENFNLLRSALRKGVINDVKVIPILSRSSIDVTNKGTQVIQRKITATADEYEAIKETGI